MLQELICISNSSVNIYLIRYCGYASIIWHRNSATNIAKMCNHEKEREELWSISINFNEKANKMGAKIMKSLMDISLCLPLMNDDVEMHFSLDLLAVFNKPTSFYLLLFPLHANLSILLGHLVYITASNHVFQANPIPNSNYSFDLLC